MPYIIVYDEIFDDLFQCEVNAETMLKAKAKGIEVYKESFASLPIKSRYHSIRHLYNED